MATKSVQIESADHIHSRGYNYLPAVQLRGFEWTRTQSRFCNISVQYAAEQFVIKLEGHFVARGNCSSAHTNIN